jgi:hypothetical protein
VAAEAVYGFVGVLLGSGTTALLTIYRERLVSTREREARQHQREHDRIDQRDIFQRESLLALQEAVSDLIKAVYNEQDRMLEEMRQTGYWPSRQWETPTATGWEDANLRLQAYHARVFEKALRDTAREIRDEATKCIYAKSPDRAKELNDELREQHMHFNELVANVLPELY